MTPTYAAYIAGQWIEPRDPIDVCNPATSEIFARMGTVDRAQVDEALRNAAAAFPAWKSLAGRQRGDYLLKAAANLATRSDELARAITLENGKPLGQSRGEVNMAIDHLRWFAEEGSRTYGRIIPHQVAGKRHFVLQAPIGVVGAIAPWNFPLVLAVRKVAPALAAGCPVVLKPASATPISAVLFTEALQEAGLPAGVFQLVAGSARMIATAMLESRHCKKVTFTGSTAVGKELIRAAADRVTKLSLELGGHAPMIVFEDADVEKAAAAAAIAKFRNAGQSCIAASRIYVQRPIHDAFVSAFTEKARTLRLGSGLEADVDMGPLINATALEHSLKHIKDARTRGASVVCGGSRWLGSAHGYFLEPTVLTDVPDDAHCMREETFAPVAPIRAFDTDDEAIRLANDSDYGLAAYVLTRDLSRAWRLAEAIEAGTIGLNDAVPSTSQCPFGGWKESGWGRELGSEGIQAFLDTKHVSLGLV